MTHTTLGDRWIYDACHDPVYLLALLTTIATGGREADLFTARQAGLVPEPVDTHVRGSGSMSAVELPDLSALDVTHEGTTTRIHADSSANIAVTLFRRPAHRPAPGTARSMLTGTWPGQSTPLTLAALEEWP